MQYVMEGIVFQTTLSSSLEHLLHACFDSAELTNKLR